MEIYFICSRKSREVKRIKKTWSTHAHTHTYRHTHMHILTYRYIDIKITLLEMKKALNEIDRWLDTAEEQISEDIANYPSETKKVSKLSVSELGDNIKQPNVIGREGEKKRMREGVRKIYLNK